ncbi:MAG: glycerol kinase, partial [Agathobaculum sp.]
RRPVIRETTALGACYLAGLATGVWSSREELTHLWRCDTLYQPRMRTDERQTLLCGWDRAVGRSLDWAPHE